jgi:flavin reductase (DIM6/NTAB) family NADH-FMN oxidoreductase RutF
VSASTVAAKRCDRELFRDVIGHFASGVTVITARHEGVDYGMTASAVSSLSLEPPMLLVCVNKATVTRKAISGSGVFGVNILQEDSPIRTAKQLEGRSLAVNTLKNVNDVTDRYALAKRGADQRKLRFTELELPEMTAALAPNRIAAATVIEPF